MPATLKHTLQQLLPQERKRFFLFAAADMIITVLDIVLLVVLLALADFYIHQGHPASLFFRQLFSGNPMPMAALLLVLFTIKNAAAYYVTAAQFRFVYAVASRLSQKKCLQFLEGTYRDYVSTDAAVYIKQISQQPVEFAHYVLSGWQQVITQLLLLLFTAVAIMLYNPVVFLLLVVLLLPPVVLVARYTRKKIRTVRTVVKDAGEVSLQYVKEALAGFVESKLYGKEYFFTNRYAGRQQELNRQLAALQSVQAIPSRLMELAVVAGFVLLVMASGISSRFSLQFFAVGAFMAAAYKIIPGAVKIMNHAALIKTYSYTLQQPSVEVEKNLPVKQHIEKIEVKNISFGYQQNLLEQFSCCLKPGDMAGISTASGKGKTTLVNILLGFEEVQAGEIFFNGKPVTAAARLQHRTGIAYVKQQPFLMHDTVERNITLGDTASEQRLHDAVCAAGIDSWLAGSGKNLQFVITENGKNISGGQRQRIAVARALYKNADVIILDEPFSEMDSCAEKKLLEYFRELAAKGKIILLITHNKESLSYCNKIIWTDA